MSEDAKTVQPSTTSQAGAEPKADSKETAKQPSQEEIISTLLAKALKEELPKLIDPLKRELQSTKDKSVAEVDKATQRATEMYNAMMAAAGGDDPELRLRLQQAGSLAQQRIAQQAAYEDMSRRKQQEFDRDFKDAHTQFVKEIGLDPDDKGIDWGEGEGDYLTKLKKIQKSVAKLVKARMKEESDKTKKTLNDVNSVDTSMAGGSSGDGIPTDMTKFRKWVSKISDEDYKKLKPKIDEMMNSGQIK